ncbi:hypothetical protein K8R78_02305 [bacterium]|nr:hypothetical protein [bacterium]
MKKLLPLLAISLLLFACGEETTEAPLSKTIFELFEVSEELLVAAETIETDGFDTAAWLTELDKISASTDNGNRAKAALRESIGNFGSYAVTGEAVEYVLAIESYERFDALLSLLIEADVAERGEDVLE